mgnify:FL=1
MTHEAEVVLLAPYKVPSSIANNTADDDKPMLETMETNVTQPPPLCDVCSLMEEEQKQFASSYCVVCEQKFCVVHLQVMYNMGLPFTYRYLVNKQAIWLLVCLGKVGKNCCSPTGHKP